MAEHTDETDETTGALTRWRQTEPLRLWLYGVTVPLVALLVGYGLLSGHLAGLWLAVATAALLGGGVEVARGFVVAPATARAAARDAGLQTGHLLLGEVDAEVRTRADDAARYVSIRYRIPS